MRWQVHQRTRNIARITPGPIQFYTAQLAPIGHSVRLSGNSLDRQLNAAHVDCAACETTFIGDYFGNTAGETAGRAVDYSTFVSTYDDGTNPRSLPAADRGDHRGAVTSAG